MRDVKSRWLLLVSLVAAIAVSVPVAGSASASQSAKSPNSIVYDGKCLTANTVNPSLVEDSGLVWLFASSTDGKILGSSLRLPITIDGVPKQPSARSNCWVRVPMTNGGAH